LTDQRSWELDELLSLTWGKLMMQEQFEAAAAVALAGCFAALETNNEGLRQLSRSILFKAVEELKSNIDSSG
jgi:hypothetical protein